MLALLCPAPVTALLRAGLPAPVPGPDLLATLVLARLLAAVLCPALVAAVLALAALSLGVVRGPSHLRLVPLAVLALRELARVPAGLLLAAVSLLGPVAALVVVVRHW